MLEPASDCLRVVVDFKYGFDTPLFESSGRAKGSDKQAFVLEERKLFVSALEAFEGLVFGGCLDEMKTVLCGGEKSSSSSAGATMRAVVSLVTPWGFTEGHC